MNLWSISFAFRLGLGFHALNNEGADGSNLMQPRRIDVGSVTYDGISGEIVRHHILENFVNICRAENMPMLPMSEALHPDRGPIGIRAAAKMLDFHELNAGNLFQSVREAIRLCPVLDVGGYLAAWKEQGESSQKKEYVAEKPYIDSSCAVYKDAQPVKRETCFDVAWLISENPQDLSATQHSAFRDTFAMNSRYTQIMRSNVYGGVIRADLHRVGTDDVLVSAYNGRQSEEAPGSDGGSACRAPESAYQGDLRLHCVAYGGEGCGVGPSRVPYGGCRSLDPQPHGTLRLTH